MLMSYNLMIFFAEYPNWVYFNKQAKNDLNIFFTTTWSIWVKFDLTHH